MAILFSFFFVAVFFSFQTLFHQKRLIEKESRIDIWFLAQTEIELLRLKEALLGFQLGKPEIGHDKVLERFEIFWSRLPILLQGSQSANLRKVEGVTQTAEHAIETLEEIEPAVMSLDRRDDKGISLISHRLAELQGPFHQMVERALIHRDDLITADRRLHDSYYLQLLGFFATLLLGGAVLFIMFYRQIGRAESLLLETQAAELAAKEAQHQLVVAIESISEGFVLYDRDDRVVLFNERYKELHPAQAPILRIGITFADLLRESAARGGVQVPGGDLEGWIQRCTAARRQPSAPFETQLSNGVWLKISERTTTDGGIVGVHTDITDRKRREAELTRKSALLQATFSNIDQGIAVFDCERCLIAWNDQFITLNGLTPEFVCVGLPYPDLARRVLEGCDQDPSSINAEITDHLRIARQLTSTPESRHRFERGRADGTVIEITFNAMPAGGFIKTYRDITDRVRAEASRTQVLEHKVEQRTRQLQQMNELMRKLSIREDELRRANLNLQEREERLNAALLASHTSTYRWNLRTNSLEEDESTERLMGVQPADIRNLDDYYKYVHPDDRQALEDAAEKCAREGSDLSIDYRIIRPDGSICWVAERGKVFFDDEGKPVYMTGAIVDITERKRFEEHQRLLLAELSHRVKNTLAVVLSIALQTLRRSPSLDAFGETYRGRVSALSRAHSLLTRADWRGVGLKDLVYQTIAPYRPLGNPDISVCGSAVQLRPKPSLALALVLHELATNAVKYGSLSSPFGRLKVEWRTEAGEEGDILRLFWHESGGNAIKPPRKRGFGSALIEQVVSHEMDGRVQLRYQPTGLQCEIAIPMTEEIAVGGMEDRTVALAIEAEDLRRQRALG
jgi:PAS domain S-box-containing protein